MNKSVTENLLITTLVLTTMQTAHGNQSNDDSFWCAFFGWCTGNTQQQESYKPDHKKHDAEAPEGITIEDYLNQFACDLNGARHYPNRPPVIPHEEVEEMKAAARQQLHYVDLRNVNHTNQILRAVMVDHVQNKTNLDIKALKQQGHFIDKAQEQAIIKSQGENIAARLEAMKSLNGEALAQFFGESRTNMVRRYVENTTYHNSAPQNYYTESQVAHFTPAQPPHCPQSPVYQTPATNHAHNNNLRQQYATENRQKVEQCLTASQLKPNDKKRLEQLITDSTLYISSIDPQNFINLLKTSAAQLLDEQLEKEKNTLQKDVINYSKLIESIETTRAQKLADISQWLTADHTKIDNLFAGNNLQDTILENISGLSCPVCFEFFKEEHRHGQVDRIILKAADPDKSCGHSICKTCAPHYHHECSLCREEINQYDLYEKLYPSA